MATETIAIDVVARLDQLKKELASIPDVGAKAAKGLVSNLERELKKANASAAQTGAGFDKLSERTGKAVQTMGALGGVVGQLSPDMGRAITAVGSLSGVMAALSAAGITAAGVLGPIAVAIVAGAAAYAYLAREADAAEAAMERASAQAASAQAAHEGLDKVVSAAADRYRVASGQISAAALSTEKQIEEAEGAFMAEARAIYDSATADEAKLAALTGLERKRQGTIALIKASALAEEQSQRATEAKAAADKAAGEAARELADARKAAGDAALAAAAQDQQVADAVDAFRATAHAATVSQLSDLDQLRAAHAMALAEQQDRYAEAAEAAHGNQQELLDLQAAYLEAREALNIEALAKEQALADKAAEAAIQQAQRISEEQLATRRATAEASANIAGASADLLGTLAEQVAGKSRKAAMAMFVASKIAGLSQAVVNTALGITAALTIPPPVGPAQAVATGIAGTAAIATIAAEQPSFHAGGTRYPDEARATVLPGESVLNRQATAALGPGGVAAMNQGGAGMGSVSLRIGRMEATEVARTDIRAGGAIPRAIARAVAAGKGRAGRSGRGPVA